MQEHSVTLKIIKQNNFNRFLIIKGKKFDMINPLDRVNILVYYGAIIDKEDYENISEKLGMNNFYASIMKHHLNFKDVGKIGESWKYVVGKEIYWDYEDHIFSFDIKDDKIIINDKEMEDINTIVLL